MIAEVETVGTLWRKKGSEVKVRVCDAGHGPMIDVREFQTAEAEPPKRKVGNTWIEGKAYVGPRKGGLWLSIEQAVQLANLIFDAAERAETIERDGAAPASDFARSGGFNDEAWVIPAGSFVG
jgi:hypothetical protein